MNVETIKSQIKVALSERFPQYSVAFETSIHGPEDIGVGVFGVPRDDVRAVEDAILDLDADLCVGKGCLITPRVRDVDTTERFYPHYMPVWVNSAGSGGTCDVEAVIFREVFVEELVTHWIQQQSAELACNEELALV